MQDFSVKLKDTNKEAVLGVLTDIIGETVEGITGEEMQFIMFALPKKRPTKARNTPAMMAGNVAPQDLANVFKFALDIAEKHSGDLGGTCTCGTDSENPKDETSH